MLPHPSDMLALGVLLANDSGRDRTNWFEERTTRESLELHPLHSPLRGTTQTESFQADYRIPWAVNPHLNFLRGGCRQYGNWFESEGEKLAVFLPDIVELHVVAISSREWLKARRRSELCGKHLSVGFESGRRHQDDKMTFINRFLTSTWLVH